MPHDPFAPPLAPLEVPIDLGPAPRRVKHAARLIVGSALVALALNAASWTGMVALPGRPPGMVIYEVVIAAVTFAFFALIAWKVYRGTNWARWIFAILVGFGVVGFVLSLGFAGQFLKSVPWPFLAAGALQTVIQVVATYFLFTGEAVPWFRR